MALPSLDHLSALTDDVGMIQHAVFDVPNRSTGYCTDDVARAFAVAVSASRFAALREEALRLGRIYLAFLHDAQLPDGRFHNFLSYDRRWLDDVGTEDALGRAAWALGYGVRFAPLDGWRMLCGRMLARIVPAVTGFEHIRAQAYAALGLAHAVEADASLAVRRPGKALRALGASLMARHVRHAEPGWDWFEEVMTYDNARLCEALLRVGTVLDDSGAVEAGLRTLDFYESVVVERGTFVPIGNAGWYPRGGPRARYGQQPLEAASLVDAGLAAYAATGSLRHRRLAELGGEWFLGKNSRRVVMLENGGCFDGLEADGPNRNMGAESTLAALAAAFARARPGAARTRAASRS